jgi:hypothetical protein
MEDKEFQQKLDKIVSKEPSKFIEESNLRVIAREYSERHQDVSGNLGKYLVSAVFIDGYQTAQKQMYTEEDMKKAIMFGADGMYGWQMGEKGYTDNQVKRFLETFKK